MNYDLRRMGDVVRFFRDYVENIKTGKSGIEVLKHLEKVIKEQNDGRNKDRAGTRVHNK